MDNILEILHELRQYTGNLQIAKLMEYKNNLLLKQILEYTYDTHKKFKIDEGKFNKFYHEQYGNHTFNEDVWKIFSYTILDHLADIKSAKDTDIIEAVQYLYNFDKPSQQLMKMIIFKDLRLGMNVKKFQKVWGDFLVQPQVQLAQKFEGIKYYDNRYSRKIDGIRCYYKDNIAMSRTNKPHKSAPLQHITEQLKSSMLHPEDWVFDGELIYLNPDGSEDFTKAISLARSDERTPECDNLYYVIFDMIKVECFMNKWPDVPFADEYNRIIAHFGKKEEKISWYTTDLPNILLIKQVKDDRFEELQEARYKNNWEGIMVRNGEAPYEYKRSSNIRKIKDMQDTEVKLVDMEEGTGKLKDSLGALIADYQGFKLKIGSGLSEEQRKEYWNNRDKYIGKYIKVKYFEKTTNQQGGQSLRFPIFVCFRDLDTMEEYTKC